MIKSNSKMNVTIWWCKSSKILLALSWIIGMLLGVLAACAASDYLIPMMHGSISCPVSIPGLLAATLLPFLISAYAVFLSEPWLLLIISAFKAFGFSFCACGISLAFGQSSWLVRFLLLFSDLCLIPLLYFYWVRHIQGEEKSAVWELPVLVGTALLVGSIDYCLIAPFLVSLIES